MSNHSNNNLKKTNEVNVNEDNLQQSKQELFAAIRGHPDHSACLEALALAPELVEQESNPLAYLQAADSIEAAAGRFCRYWSSRKETFRERHLCSMMDLTGEGTLSEKDLEHLGMICELPKDQEGRPVILMKYDTLDAAVVADVFPRILFYVLNKLAIEQAEASLEQGFVVLRFLEEAGLTMQVFKETRTLTQAQLNVFPGLRLHRYYAGHVAAAGGKTQKKFVSMSPKHSVMPSLMASTCHSLASKLQPQWASGAALLVKKMEACGFRKAGLPVSFGGTWQYAASPTPRTGHRTTLNAFSISGDALSLQKENTSGLTTTPQELEVKLQALEQENARLTNEIVSLCGKSLPQELKEELPPLPAHQSGEEETKQEEHSSSQDGGFHHDATPVGQQELAVLKGRVCVALSVVALLQEEKQCSLGVLLRDADTMATIRALVEQQHHQQVQGNARDDVVISHAKEVFQSLCSTLRFLAVLEETKKESWRNLLGNVEMEDMLSHIVRGSAFHLLQSDKDQERSGAFVEVLATGVVDKIRTLYSDASDCQTPPPPSLLDTVLGSYATDPSRRHHVVRTMVESVLEMTPPPPT